jgi:hypothetical protein
VPSRIKLPGSGTGETVSLNPAKQVVETNKNAARIRVKNPARLRRLNYLLRLRRQAAYPIPAAAVPSRIRLPGSGTGEVSPVPPAHRAAQASVKKQSVNRFRFIKPS